MHKTNNRLLACGVLAGPLFVVAVAIQAFTRHGFDLTKQSASMLTLGSAGWIQSANFLLTGALMLAFATGLRRVLNGRPAGKWAPRLLYIAGAGLMGGAVFHPDAGAGFPPGTPSGESVVRSWHGVLHQVCGSSAFLALIILCFVLARYLQTSGPKVWAIVSRAAGAVFAACVIAASGPDGSLTLFVGAAVVFIWIAFVGRQLITTESTPSRAKSMSAATQPVKQLG